MIIIFNGYIYPVSAGLLYSKQQCGISHSVDLLPLCVRTAFRASQPFIGCKVLNK